MKVSFKPFALICMLNSITPTQAADFTISESGESIGRERVLQEQVGPQSGQFCSVSTNVRCYLPGDKSSNCDLGVQPFETCGERYLTFEYKICNQNVNGKIIPLRTNPDGEDGTVAMYRQQFGKPAILLSPLSTGQDNCRIATVTEEVNTCKQRVVGSLKFEGWVDGRVDEDGYYCYNFDFLEVPFFKETEPPQKPPTPPTTAADIGLQSSCMYRRNNRAYFCGSTDFNALTFSSCSIEIIYINDIINYSGSAARIYGLYDSSLSNLVDGSDIVPAGNALSVETNESIDICTQYPIEKKFLALATPDGGGEADTAKDSVNFNTPLLPLNLRLDSVTCVIDDSTETDCKTYLTAVTSQEQCIVDIKFKYEVKKTSLGCVDITGVRSVLGPLGGSSTNAIQCDARTICQNESVTIPDSRPAVNICTMSQNPNPWTTTLTIRDNHNREPAFNLDYQWPIFTNPPPPPPAPTPTPPSGGGVLCKRRPNKISFQIVPISCDQSSNSFVTTRNRRALKHKRTQYSCSGERPTSGNSYFHVTIYNGEEEEVFNNNVKAGEEQVLTEVTTYTRVSISGNNKVQDITFHSSCSKPISTGDTFGSFKIVNFIY